MAIQELIEGRERDLGGFFVRRVLPAAGRQMVGPFIFFDHLGPAQFEPGSGIDVRPHPHISLATVTYLFAGSLEHRDSLGNVREIRPGDVNWMTAGRGIAHSERTPRLARAAGENIHGIQSWVALPTDTRMSSRISRTTRQRASATKARRRDLAVIAGDAFGLFSCRNSLADAIRACTVHGRRAHLKIPAEHTERAVYLVQGEITVDGVALPERQLAVLEAGSEPTLRARRDSRAMLLGGEHFSTPRHIWWNFVASTPERIDAAKLRWANRQFAPVPGETEFIPLPHQ